MNALARRDTRSHLSFSLPLFLFLSRSPLHLSPPLSPLSLQTVHYVLKRAGASVFLTDLEVQSPCCLLPQTGSTLSRNLEHFNLSTYLPTYISPTQMSLEIVHSIVLPSGNLIGHRQRVMPFHALACLPSFAESYLALCIIIFPDIWVVFGCNGSRRWP